MSLAVAAQVDAVSGAHLPDLRFDTIEVTRHEQVRLPVPIDVRGEKPVHGRNLRLERQRHHGECAVAVVPHQCRREGVGVLHHRVAQILFGEDVRDRLPRVVLVVEVAVLEEGQRADQIVAQREGIRFPIVVVGDDLLHEAVVSEILHVHRHRLTRVRLEPGVETEIGHYEINPAMTGKIPGDDAVPPAVALLESRHVHLHELPVTGVVEDRDGHPLADDDEVRPAISVDVLPHGIGHHADVRETGRCLVGDICELATTIIS